MNANMKHVGILVGGTGPEAQVSLCSGKFVFTNFPLDYATPFFIHIDASLRFSLHRDDQFMQGSGNLYHAKKDIRTYPMVQLLGELQNFGIVRENLLGIFPLVHGTLGEDGQLLAYLDTLQIPYAGCTAQVSQICFDKVLTKLSLLTAGVEIVPFIWGTKLTGVESHPFESATIYVKPARQGSSIGISRIENGLDCKAAVENAFQFDTKILIEPEIPGRELEVAVLETKDGWIISRAGEILAGRHEYYSYEAKYALESDAMVCIAELDLTVAQVLKEQAQAIIDILELRGFARLDFFLDANQKLWLNEVNTLPGFTGISMFPLLMEEEGVEPTDLIQFILEGMRING